MKTELFAGVRHLQSETSAPDWNLSRNPSVYAYEVEALANRLRWDRQKTATAFLERNDMNSFRGIGAFKNTSAAATFNPHKPLDDSPYFIETSTLSDLDILLPYPDGSIRHSHVVHIGPKGSGKTSVQNQWLYRNHELLEQKKVFYVRCDAPKLFEFWERHYENPERWPLDSLPTVEEYIDFQTLYILAKYSDKGLPAEILAYLEKANILFEYKEDRAIDSPKRTKKSVAWYLVEHIARNISVYERGDATRSYLVGSLFEDKPTRRREYFRWKECADAVRSWMRERGYIALRILDGVDNLHVNTDGGKAIYAKFLPEIRKFILRSCPAGEIHFAVMRNRTWIDVQNRDPVTQGSPLTVSPREIEHTPPRSVDVLNARIDWLKTDVRIDRECVRALESACRNMPSGTILHDNMRTVIVGAASLAEQIRFRSHQLGVGHIDTEHHAKVQVRRNLFLNGRFFLETQRSYASMNREKGLPFLNPFWFSDDFVLRSGYRDPLFLRIRLLELLDRSDKLESDLRTILSKNFEFDPDAVSIAIDDARAFGWIDTKSEHMGTSHLTLEISEMGRYLLHELLCDINCLYILALDTRLPKALFDDDLIQVHSNHLNERSGYIGAAAITLISFLNWVNSCNLHEISSAQLERPNAVFKKVFLSPASLRRITSQFGKMLKQAGSEDWELLGRKCSVLTKRNRPISRREVAA